MGGRETVPGPAGSLQRSQTLARAGESVLDGR